MNRLWLGTLGVLLLASVIVAAQELHTLTTPTTATTTTYTLTYVGIDVTNLKIVVNLTSNTGALLSKVYDNTTVPTGATLLHQLNTSNFTVTSLVKQVYQRLATDGVIPAGTISGPVQD